MGDKSYLPDHLRQSFETTGTLHILATSGLHLSILTVSLFAVMPFLSRSQWLLGVWLLLSVYVLLVGMRPSILRAWMMISIHWLALLFHRPYSPLRSLLVSSLVLLLLQPGWIADVGFQLSYLATGGIVVFVPLVQTAISGFQSQLQLPGLTRLTSAKSSLIQLARDNAVVSLVAVIATAPIQFLQFGSWRAVSFIPSAIIGLITPLVLQLSYGLVLVSGAATLFSDNLALSSTVRMIVSVISLPLFTILVQIISWLDAFDWGLIRWPW